MIKRNFVAQTDETRNYNLKGKNQKFIIYQIPLNQLKYNTQNGRIASYISQYLEDHDFLPEDYNSIVESFIVKSNEKAFNKTKENIRLIGQMEPAIVLSNGVVVDGNRRFTALRQLSREGNGSAFGYLKAAILEADSLTAKEIKTLELNLQHAREERVDYNPIEFLVDIYRDLVANGAEFTPEEYARETQMTIARVKKEMRKSQLMVDFLEYINKPHKYYIARDLKLDGPLGDIDTIVESKKVDPSFIDEIKEYLFFNLAIIRKGDITRIIRSMRPIIEDIDKFEEAVDDVADFMDDLHDYFQSDKYADEIGALEVPEKIREEGWSKTSELIEIEKLSQAQQKPVQTARKAFNQIETIDMEAASRMSESDKEDLRAYLNQIINISIRINEKIDA